MPATPSSSRLYAVLAAVFVAAFLAFANTAWNGFAYDDVTLRMNADVLGTRPASAAWLHDFWGYPVDDPASHKSYRPLAILSLRLDHWLGGGGPALFHLVNAAAHAAVAACVAALAGAVAARWLDAPSPRRTDACALVAGLLFAWHPVHCDAVAPVVGRAELLAALAYLAALALHASAAERSEAAARDDSSESVFRGWGARFAASLAASLVALLCKETGFTAVVVGTAYDALLLAGLALDAARDRGRTRAAVRFGAAAVVRALVAAVVVLFALAARYAITQSGRPVIDPQYNYVANHPHAWARTLTWPLLHTQHALLLLWPLPPVPLAPDWSYQTVPMVLTLADPRNLGSLLFYAAALAAAPAALLRAWWKRGARRGAPAALLLCWAAVLVPFLPVANIAFTCGFEVAERVLYIPSAGLCVAAGLAFACAGFAPDAVVKGRTPSRGRRRRALLWAALVAVLAAWLHRTVSRNRDWRSERTLWAAAVRDLPLNAKAHFNHANELLREAEGMADGDDDARRGYLRREGLAYMRRASELGFRGSFAADLGVALFKNGLLDEAERVFRRAAREGASVPRSERSLGSLLLNRAADDARTPAEAAALRDEALAAFQRSFMARLREDVAALAAVIVLPPPGEPDALLEPAPGAWRCGAPKGAALPRPGDPLPAAKVAAHDSPAWDVADLRRWRRRREARGAKEGQAERAAALLERAAAAARDGGADRLGDTTELLERAVRACPRCWEPWYRGASTWLGAVDPSRAAGSPLLTASALHFAERASRRFRGDPELLTVLAGARLMQAGIRPALRAGREALRCLAGLRGTEPPAFLVSLVQTMALAAATEGMPAVTRRAEGVASTLLERQQTIQQFYDAAASQQHQQ